MRVFKNREFSKWAAREGVSDGVLRKVIAEMERGLVGVNLGGQVFKKRMALSGRGKSSGARTLVAYRIGGRAFFIYGFAKNVKDNIKADELKALKASADTFLIYSNEELNQVVKAGTLIEVTADE